MAAHILELEVANAAATKRKKRKKKQIQKGGTLLQAEAESIVAQRDAEAQVEVERREERAQAGASRGSIQRCTRCNIAGHNKRTCKADAAEIGD